MPVFVHEGSSGDRGREELLLHEMVNRRLGDAGRLDTLEKGLVHPAPPVEATKGKEVCGNEVSVNVSKPKPKEELEASAIDFPYQSEDGQWTTKKVSVFHISSFFQG